jgi:hypothetical protein
MLLLKAHTVRYPFQFVLKEGLDQPNSRGSKVRRISIMNPLDDFSTSSLFKITFSR